MTTSASATIRFDRAAIMSAAWIEARRIAAKCDAGLRYCFKVALRAAWFAVKHSAPIAEPATQKSIARALDRAAGRSSYPASSKQCWFLASLILKAGEDGSDWLLDTNSALSKDKASSLISFYTGC